MRKGKTCMKMLKVCTSLPMEEAVTEVEIGCGKHS
jgi:hypothetical protein